jgi:hypothetical protein
MRLSELACAPAIVHETAEAEQIGDVSYALPLHSKYAITYVAHRWQLIRVWRWRRRAQCSAVRRPPQRATAAVRRSLCRRVAYTAKSQR